MHKKLFFGLLLFSLVTVILAGCGIVDVATTPSGTSTPSAQTTGGGGGSGASQQFGAPVDMTSKSSVTLTIDNSPASATCQPACFTPLNVKVKVGTTITWVNKSSTPHTVTAIKGENPSTPSIAANIFDSGVSKPLAAGQSFTYKVSMAAYNFNPNHLVVYYCQIHPVMVGAIFIAQ